MRRKADESSRRASALAAKAGALRQQLGDAPDAASDSQRLEKRDLEGEGKRMAREWIKAVLVFVRLQVTSERLADPSSECTVRDVTQRSNTFMF